MEISVKAIIITIMTSIITTVITTLIINYINSKKEKRSEQIKAFKILLSTRSFFNDYDNVKTLNTIDVIFSDVPKVLERWREYYEILKNDNALFRGSSKGPNARWRNKIIGRDVKTSWL